MLRTRIIPALLLYNESLVKTHRFGNFDYVGDPCNTVRIFNELEVDELLFLDISAPRTGHAPNIELLANIANECFMPLGYGGGVKTVDQASSIYDVGFEKVALNSSLIDHPELLTQIANRNGSQAVIASIDIKSGLFNRNTVKTHGGKKSVNKSPVSFAKELEDRGAGEILLTSIDREGTWSGFDYHITKEICDEVSIPVIAHGGAGSLLDIRKVVKECGASAVALGSMIVYQKKGMGVLVNFPDHKQLEVTLK